MKSIKIVIVILILILFQNPAICQDKGTTGSTFLKLGPGARAIGMGSAFTGLSDDVSAIYWNPAGLGFTKRWELSFNYQRLFADFDYQALFYSHQLRLLASRKATLGFGLIRLGSIEDWDSTNDQMPEIKADDISDLAIFVPFAYRLDWLSPHLALGMNYKYVKNKLVNYTSHSHGLDFGFMFKTEVFRSLFFSLGTSVQNITLKKIKFIEDAESLPFIFRTGSALKIFLTDNQDITISYDLSRPQDNTIKHNMGMEYWLHLGAHRFGFRGGYRFIDDDLGKISFSIGYGVDISPANQNSIYTQLDYALNNYNTEILGNTNLGSVLLKPNNPESFRRLTPEMNEEFLSRIEYLLTWEETNDYDDHDRVEYLVVVDTNYTKINHIKNNAKQIIKDLIKERSELDAIFYKITSNNSTIFQFSEDSDFQSFFWAVIAFDRNINITIATGSDEVGKFYNRNLPDIEPISLIFSSATQLDTSKYQGELEAKIIGRVKKPCRVVIYDSTESKIICSEVIPELAVADTFTFGGEWWTTHLGKHKMCVIADFENSISERDESNNLFEQIFPTIPYGYISVKDTTRLEELSYEHIELPTIPFIFFESNSVELSHDSRTNNENDPDSLLKLFGERLKRDYPGLKITVRGYVDPNSESPTTDKTRLSLLRAQKVKEKLVEYGARQSQILVLQNHIDTEPRVERTSTIIDPIDLEMVNEENRRVEIGLPDDLPTLKKVEYEKRFFAPRIIMRKKNEILSEKIQFNCLLHSSIPLQNLTILINEYHEDPFPIKVMIVDTIPEDKTMKFTLEWAGIKDNGQMIAFNKTFYFTAFAVDTAGKLYDIPMQDFYVGREVIVKEKRIFALAKFNKVAPLHQFYLEQLDQVEDMMKKDRMIKIRFYGHTDVIGTEERNNILSTDRAMELSSWLAKIIDFDYRLTDSLKTELKSRIDNPFSATSPDIDQKFRFGKGETSPLIAKNIEYGNNNIPQGRTLNRRVDIEIYRMGEIKKPELVVEKNITFHPWYGLIIENVLAKKQYHGKRAERELANPNQRMVYIQNTVQTNPVLLASTERFETLQNPVNTVHSDFMAQDTTKPQNQTVLPDSSQATGSDIAEDSLKIHAASSDQKKEKEKPFTIEISPALVNQVTCIELQDSIIWLGTENGLIKWDVNKDTFQVIGLDLWKYKHITALTHDPKENCLWVGTKKGLREFAEDQWILDFNVGTGLSGNVINCILKDKSGNLLLGTNEGINIRKDIGWRVLANVDSGLPDDNVNYIYEDNDGVLWACTNKGVCFKTKQGRWFPFEGNFNLVSDTVYCMVTDLHGNKWFGTAEGLCKFNNKNQLIKFSTFDNSDNVRTDKILSITKDKSQILWCATENGLAVYHDETWYSYNYNDGLPANYVNTIFVGDDNKKFVGFNGGGISILRLP
jgi:outer membrane protein OmpA-like peptidoglycan-associated protein